jgi:hypothetical protein
MLGGCGIIVLAALVGLIRSLRGVRAARAVPQVPVPIVAEETPTSRSIGAEQTPVSRPAGQTPAAQPEAEESLTTTLPGFRVTQPKKKGPSAEGALRAKTPDSAAGPGNDGESKEQDVRDSK